MKLLFSVPSGYHMRELVVPLRQHLEADDSITEVHIVSPAAPQAPDIFKEFNAKFIYHKNPVDDAGHQELFTRIQPDVVITNTVGHDALDEPILRNAKTLGITTCTFIASWDNVWKIARLIESRIPIVTVDHFIVWNTMMKEHLLRIFPNIPVSSIAVIGAPRLDYFWQKDHTDSKEEVYKKLGFADTSRPFIHVATTELYHMGYIVKTIRSGIDNKSIPGNPYIYASVHPGGSMERYEPWKRYGITVRFSPGRREQSTLPMFKYSPTQADIHFLVGIFTHASVLVNHSSTVALESLLAGVPVVTVSYGKPFDFIQWRRSMVYRDFHEHYKDLLSDGATYITKSKSDLIDAIVQSQANPHAKDTAREATVKKMITTTDGTASKQVLNFIKSI